MSPKERRRTARRTFTRSTAMICSDFAIALNRKNGCHKIVATSVIKGEPIIVTTKSEDRADMYRRRKSADMPLSIRATKMQLMSKK